MLPPRSPGAARAAVVSRAWPHCALSSQGFLILLLRELDLLITAATGYRCAFTGSVVLRLVVMYFCHLIILLLCTRLNQQAVLLLFSPETGCVLLPYSTALPSTAAVYSHCWRYCLLLVLLRVDVYPLAVGSAGGTIIAAQDIASTHTPCYGCF